MRRGQNLFKKKAGEKPVWEIIQAHHLFNVPAGTPVVPGAELSVGQKASGEKFPDKDAEGVNSAPEIKGEIFQRFKCRRKQAYTSIDGEHPKGGASEEPHIAFPEGIKGSKNNFKGPSKESAFKKVFQQSFHHNISMRKRIAIYTQKAEMRKR